MRTILLLVVMVLCTFTTNAQVVAEWNCDNVLNATFVDGTYISSASDITPSSTVLNGYSAGCDPVTVLPGDMSARFNNWPLQPTLVDLGYYIEVQVILSQDMVFNTLKLTTYRSSTGPTDFQVRWSVNGFSAPVLYANYTTSIGQCATHVVGLGATVVSASTAVSFRFYAGGAGGSTGRWFVDDIQVEAVPATTLPVELLYFDGVETESGPLLEWATATEENNSHFTLERSLDQSSWELVTNMPGAGNSIGQIDYSYLDREAKVGWNYYRLTQTDYDGEHEVFGQIVPVHFSVRNELVYPNPGRVGETINVPNGSTIVDQSGRMVLTGVSQFVPSAPGIYLVGRQKLLIE